MDFMPIIPFLGVSLPESLVLYYMMSTLAGKRVSFCTLAALALVTSLISYFIRLLPIAFGVHSFLQLAMMTIFLILFLKLPWRRALTVVIFAGIILGLAEGIFVPFLAWFFSLNLNQIISDPLLRIAFTLPHLAFLAGLTYTANKRQWRLSLIKKSPLFTLCLVQAFMLALLMISFHIYASGVYPSFTINTLINISIIVILISALATIFVALYLLKVVEREARLQAELRHAKEKNKLNVKIQVERHDFYNHLTAIYGYIKIKKHDQLQAYIENLYQSVRHIKSLLDIEPPELSALLSVKKEEALKKGIDFRWQVNVNNKTLALSPEDLTHLLGNLLDNALDAAKDSHNPKIDLILNCSKLGLELKVANTGSPIPPDIRNNIFAAGYTTKDKSQHSGLGLYIINEIIQRLGGRLELREPEDYPGVQFAIYIPWNKE
ncbi:sensor histidine kinase [Desulfitibacter alkalitolerans]|uniref:sensor histidine kinase n=1 Tax=Desulfitibacter alkalitolerans TaxID=264641 RepID=UPI00048A17AF|nr:ATP-binding protein [Desulfitibacter alkalitolerans]